MRTEYLYLGDDVFSKQTVLITLENLYYLQRESIKTGTTPSEIINQLIKHQREATYVEA